jgi:hypothetical protein
MLQFDLFGNLPDGFFAFGGDVFGFSFGEEAEEVNQVAVRQKEVEDARSAAGAFAFRGHSGFAHAAATDEKVSFVGPE